MEGREIFPEGPLRVMNPLLIPQDSGRGRDAAAPTPLRVSASSGNSRALGTRFPSRFRKSRRRGLRAQGLREAALAAGARGGAGK